MVRSGRATAIDLYVFATGASRCGEGLWMGLRVVYRLDVVRPADFPTFGPGQRDHHCLDPNATPDGGSSCLFRGYWLLDGLSPRTRRCLLGAVGRIHFATTACAAGWAEEVAGGLNQLSKCELLHRGVAGCCP